MTAERVATSTCVHRCTDINPALSNQSDRNISFRFSINKIDCGFSVKQIVTSNYLDSFFLQVCNDLDSGKD